jgi:hypothetical protein
VAAAGNTNAMVCSDYEGGDIYTTDFTSADFAGLDWLLPSTYSGIQKYRGRDCIVFNGSVSPLSPVDQKIEHDAIEEAKVRGWKVPEETRVAAVAYIDLETRLPLFAQFGGQKRFYQFGAAPTAPLQLPAQLASAEAAYEHKIQRLSARASRPF